MNNKEASYNACVASYCQMALRAVDGIFVDTEFCKDLLTEEELSRLEEIRGYLLTMYHSKMRKLEREGAL